MTTRAGSESPTVTKAKSTSISGWKRHLEALSAHLQQLEDRVATRENESGWKEGLKLAASLRGHFGGIASECARARELLPQHVEYGERPTPEGHLHAAVHLCERALDAIRSFEVRLRLGAESATGDAISGESEK